MDSTNLGAKLFLFFICLLLLLKVTQSCLTLCDPMVYTVHGILQARILEWVAFPFSRVLPNPGIESRSPALLADSLPAEPQGLRIYLQLCWVFITARGFSLVVMIWGFSLAAGAMAFLVVEHSSRVQGLQ